jgi:hypothetical protein
VYRLDKGAVLDKFFHFLQALGVLDLMGHVQGKRIKRAMVPGVQYLLLYGLKMLFGIEGMHALPALLFSEEAMMCLVGFNAHQVRHGVCQARRGQAVASTHHRAHMSGHPGSQHGEAESAGPGGLVQRGHPGGGWRGSWVRR